MCCKNAESALIHSVAALQIVVVGNDVVLQCRDEGDDRVDVYWTRDVETASLPVHAVQDRGRLLIANIG